ncbi:MAG: DUF1624 domain-containing protein [Thermoplasmata archaeon]|nr:DUF1624 domain-containing protein [Thermoplasmata archaeon]
MIPHAVLPIRKGPRTREGLPRYWEIDAARGAALVNLVAFHVLFDLCYFGDLQLDLDGGPWFWYTRLSASAFIILVGVSIAISRGRAGSGADGIAERRWTRANAVRGAAILGWAMVITAMTWLAIPGDLVAFGILHLVGISVLAAPLLLRTGRYAGGTGAILVLIGIVASRVRVGMPWLTWLGLRPEGFTTVDYFPLLPWIGVVLIGICIGQRAYPRGKRRFRAPDASRVPPVRCLAFLGRNSLVLYLAHQPVVLAALQLAGAIDIVG